PLQINDLALEGLSAVRCGLASTYDEAERPFLILNLWRDLSGVWMRLTIRTLDDSALREWWLLNERAGLAHGDAVVRRRAGDSAPFSYAQENWEWVVFGFMAVQIDTIFQTMTESIFEKVSSLFSSDGTDKLRLKGINRDWLQESAAVIARNQLIKRY